MVTLIDQHPLARNADGTLRTRIATAFPRSRVLVTLPGMIHAMQRVAYTDLLSTQRRGAGQPELTEQEQCAQWDAAVDLIVDDDSVLIRPDPDNMELAYEADEMLRELVPKRKTKFLNVSGAQVRQAIQRRGEAWRIHPLPRSTEQMRAMIANSRIGIGGRAMYYHNATTGTRWLTFHEFAALGSLADEPLRQHLIEIGRLMRRRNARQHCEVDFFQAPRFGQKWDGIDFASLPPEQLRQAYQELRSQFEAAVPPALRADDPASPTWRNHMYSALVDQRGDVISEEALLGLSSEFFMQVEWLPGARLEEGELIFDSLFDEPDEGDHSISLWGDTARGLICNMMQEYADLEYINVGRVIGSLGQRGQPNGRRDVFVVQLQPRGAAHEVLQIIRMLKYGVRERLDEGKDLLRAMIESEGYNDYILDRRLGVRQLGMNLLPCVVTRKLSERYSGQQKQLNGISIWSPYIQRDYISGVATDKVLADKLADRDYSLALARLLGRAAAPNLIVGRANVDKAVIFDDGDEVLVEDDHHHPAEIVVTDHTGTFERYDDDLGGMAGPYAIALNRRIKHLCDPRAFAGAYLDAFRVRLAQIQDEYRRRRRAFDTLFKHRVRDPLGSFAYRWECVLRRLDGADAGRLAEQIRQAFVSF